MGHANDALGRWRRVLVGKGFADSLYREFASHLPGFVAAHPICDYVNALRRV